MLTASRVFSSRNSRLWNTLAQYSAPHVGTAVGLGLGTVHSRITMIYRKFSVRGRSELMAL